MINPWILGGMFAAGLALGSFFYGGLWWTVNQLAESDHPGVLTMLSFVVRTAVVGLGFYGLMAGDWLRLVVILAGFIVVRMVMVSWMGPEGFFRDRVKEEPS